MHRQTASYSEGTCRLFWFCSGTCKRGRQKGVSLICSNRSEEIGANRNKSGYSRKQGAQIRTNRKKTGKSEQIGVTPFSRPQSGGARFVWDKINLFLRSVPKALPCVKPSNLWSGGFLQGTSRLERIISRRWRRGWCRRSLYGQKRGGGKNFSVHSGFRITIRVPTKIWQ